MAKVAKERGWMDEMTTLIAISSDNRWHSTLLPRFLGLKFLIEMQRTRQ